jgi:hypothetical protein
MFTYVCVAVRTAPHRLFWKSRTPMHFRRLPRPRAGREACPYRRAVFVPETYYVTESGTPLLDRA